jgi:hypothetical protein
LQLRKEGIIRLPTPPFVESRQKEIEGLINQDVFKIVDITDIPKGTRIFNSRFVDNVKDQGTTTPYEKSRLVVQAHNDRGKEEVLTQSPTIQRSSQRIVLCIAAILDDRELCIRDISQAYVQSTTRLSRHFYIKPPKEIDLGHNNVLKVLRPLYGVPEAGTHWFRTYHRHHIERLDLSTSSYDPCLLFNDQAVVGLQTDDTLFLGTAEYIEKEETELKIAGYLAKPMERLTHNRDLAFNGGSISRKEYRIDFTQRRQCEKIRPIDTTAAVTELKGAYVRERARGAYIASTCQPEAAFSLSYAAQTTDPSIEDANQLNSRLRWQLENSARGLRFIKLKRESLRLLVFVDASFANNRDLSSQIGYVIVLANEQKKDSESVLITGNILHWSSTKCKRITRSVLASELYAMVAGFDSGSVIHSTINSILQNEREIPLTVCTDSYSLYDCVTKLGTTAEKRLMIDIMGLRQSYERREITEVRWIDGNCNPADAMTKEKPSQALRQLIETNTLKLVTKGWVDRSEG